MAETQATEAWNMRVLGRTAALEKHTRLVAPRVRNLSPEARAELGGRNKLAPSLPAGQRRQTSNPIFVEAVN